MLTNFNTVRKSVKKMQSIEKMLNDGTLDSITKKERLTLTRDKDKMEKVLGGIALMGRAPAALFLVDIGHEHIALSEAKRLGITTFGMVDTNCDPNKVDFAIPSNDDATKSIAIILDYLTAAIAEGLAERLASKDEEVEEEVTESRPNFDVEAGDARDRERGGRGGAGRGGNRGGGGMALLLVAVVRWSWRCAKTPCSKCWRWLVAGPVLPQLVPGNELQQVI
jgi:small subunit ribosomal protein S2